MRIQEEVSYKDFTGNVAAMKSKISSAIENNELVDDEFNSIKKYSFKWIVLSLMRPLYALFGQDAYRHVRVDSVARAVLRYCECNKKYLTKPLQLEVVNTLLEPLNAKTNKKYLIALDSIARSLKTARKENDVLLAERKKILLELHNASWNEGIPQIQRNPVSLVYVATLLRDAIDSSLIDPAIATSLRKKCWEYACNMQDASSAMSACKICRQAFEGLHIDDPYLAKTTVKFRADETAIVPEFYKQILAMSSRYFKSFFDGGFREQQAGEIHFPKMHRKHFLNMLSALETGRLALPGYRLDELTNFAKQMHMFELTGLHEQVIQWVIRKIREFPVDQEHLDTVDHLASLPYLMSVAGEYYERCFNSSVCDTFAKKILFVEARTLHISRLAIKECTPQEMGKIVACCPNLEVLDLSGCSSFYENSLEAVTACSKLKSLILTGWKNLTNDGLKHIVHLQSLQHLDLTDCSKISRQRLDSLADEFRNRVAISTSGCFEDVEERRRVTAQNVVPQAHSLQNGYAAGYMAGKFSTGLAPPSNSSSGYAAGYYAGVSSRYRF